MTKPDKTEQLTTELLDLCSEVSEYCKAIQDLCADWQATIDEARRELNG